MSGEDGARFEEMTEALLLSHLKAGLAEVTPIERNAIAQWAATRIAATAAAKATITKAVCKEAYERGVAAERARGDARVEALPCYYGWRRGDDGHTCPLEHTNPCPRCAAIRQRDGEQPEASDE